MLAWRKVCAGAQTLKPGRVLVSGPAQIELPPQPLAAAPPLASEQPCLAALRLPSPWLLVFLEFSPTYHTEEYVKEFLTTCVKCINLF